MEIVEECGDSRTDVAWRLRRLGLTNEEIARHMGVARSTVGGYFTAEGSQDGFSHSIRDPEACRKHWHDLLEAYPAGMPVAARGRVRFLEGPR